MMLENKSDIELMAMVADLEKQQAQINQALNICREEIMRRIEAFKTKQKQE